MIHGCGRANFSPKLSTRKIGAKLLGDIYTVGNMWVNDSAVKQLLPRAWNDYLNTLYTRSVDLLASAWDMQE